MIAGKTIRERNNAELIKAIRPMVEIGASNRRIANALNRQRLFTPRDNGSWTAGAVNDFRKRHAKKISLDYDDDESLFQNGERPSEIEDFFPYPNYGPFS